ncbi:MAG: hypothetical protein V3V97_14780, partial [Hyphomicrobiaceae bacterium]
MSSNDVGNGVETATDAPHGNTRQFSWLKLGGFCAVLALLMGGSWLLARAGQRIGTISGESIAAYVKSWGMWGHFGLVGLMIVHSFVPFPAELVAIA